MREANCRYRAWHREQQAGQTTHDGSAEDEYADAETGDAPSAAATLEEAVENAADAIREHLAATDAYDFQRLVAALLEAMGYHVIFNAPPGPDQGIDCCRSATRSELMALASAFKSSDGATKRPWTNCEHSLLY